MEIAAQLLAAGAVIGGLLVAVRALQRGSRWKLPSWAGTRRQGIIEPLDKLSLSPQHTLHLVRVADRAVLLAAHGGGCSLLESREWPEPGRTKASALPGEAR